MIKAACPDSTRQHSFSRYRNALLLSIFCAAALYVSSLFMDDAESILQAMGELSVTGWGAILALSLANYLLRYWRWQRYIQVLSGIQLSHRFHLTCYLAGFALTTTPGKAGEATRSIYLHQRGIGWNQSLSAFFVERLLDLFAILLLSLAALKAFPDYNWIGYITASLVALVLWALHSRLLRKILQRLSQASRPKLSSASSRLSALLQSSGTLLKPRLLSGGMLLGLISWGGEGAALYLILQELGAPVSLNLAIGIYGVGILAGALSFIPGGLGSTEAVMALMLVASGVDSATAIAATLLCRIATLWFAVLIGLVAMAVITTRTAQKAIN